MDAVSGHALLSSWRAAQQQDYPLGHSYAAVGSVVIHDASCRSMSTGEIRGYTPVGVALAAEALRVMVPPGFPDI